MGGSNAAGTISPQDLLIHEPFMSAPNSAAFTALTSPSPYESPDFDVYDVSPHFSTADFDAGANPWFSLFPDQVPAPEPAAPVVQDSPAPASEEPEPVPETSPAPARRKSSGSPGAGRHSSVAGVNSRRRDKPLPPIVVEDPNDTVAMKRARNTLAARKSRERKAIRFDELEERIRKLEAERDHWKSIALGRSTE
jgi:general control protein GCN4